MIMRAVHAGFIPSKHIMRRHAYSSTDNLIVIFLFVLFYSFFCAASQMSGAKDPEKEAEPPPPPSFGKVVGAVGQPWGEVPQPMMPIWAAESLKEQVAACRARYTEVRFSFAIACVFYIFLFFSFAIRFPLAFLASWRTKKGSCSPVQWSVQR